MCASSMVGDHYRDMWKPKPWYGQVDAPPSNGLFTVGRAEFDELKRQVGEMKELLTRAIKYDKDTGQPHCEVDDKMDLLRRVAKLVGVSLDDVIKK